MKIQAISPDDEQAKRLIGQSDELMASLYPPESNHMEGSEALKKPNVLFAFITSYLFGGVKVLLKQRIRRWNLPSASF
jgi:hypothetical protein